jgi:hypothetical protein
MTLLRHGGSGSALLDQIVAETLERRRMFFPPVAPTIVRRPKQNPFKCVYLEHGKWVTKIRAGKNSEVIFRASFITAQAARDAYCAALLCKGDPVLLEELKKSILEKPTSSERPAPNSQPPEIRKYGCLTMADIQKTVSWLLGVRRKDIMGTCR